MASEQISVDFINISPNDVVYTVSDDMADKAKATLELLGYEPYLEKHCAKVSVVGAGITGVPGVASKIVTALSNQGIRILQSADSYTTIWVLVKQDDLKKRSMHFMMLFNWKKPKSMLRRLMKKAHL